MLTIEDFDTVESDISIPASEANVLNFQEISAGVVDVAPSALVVAVLVPPFVLRTF